MTETGRDAEDRSLFGDGRYPETGLLAILARLGFLGGLVAIVVAVFLPRSLVPQLLHSHYLEHFAAFYCAFLLGLAAMPRSKLRRVALAYALFAAALEATHLLAGAPFRALVDKWVADMGGLTAAAAPVVVERFRRRFPRKVRREPAPPTLGPSA
jgi:hypothetical protein